MTYYIAMQVNLAAGTYVLAISGGVDSIVLLDILALQARLARPNLRLIVAHFDHGIREDSQLDRQNVQSRAFHYGLPFVYQEGKLGVAVSESSARQARYDFLETVRNASAARAIITAHHQDDLIETAIHNLTRGSGRKGLSSMADGGQLLRPFLNQPKKALVMYAEEHGLAWREDTTNQDLRYRRNYIRHKIMSRFDASSRQQFLDMITLQRQLNQQIDYIIDSQLDKQPASNELDRAWFCSLTHDVSKEVMASFLRRRTELGFDSQTLERLTIGAKVSRPGKRLDVTGGHYLKVGINHLALM
jgi:tRNA(Ile)-lysidine synthetase-like protein